MPLQLRYSDLAKHISTSSLRRGTTYYRRGAVSEVALVDSRTIVGYVRGSSSKPYETRIMVSQGGGIERSECTCPLGGFCKHVAALALAAFDELANNPYGTLVLVEDQRPAWEKSVASLLELENETIEEQRPAYELYLAIRLYSLKKQPASLQVRPRVFDRKTGQFSFKIKWPAFSVYSRNFRSDKLSVEQAFYLRQLATTLELYPGSLRDWETVPEERIGAFWSVLKTASEHRVGLLTEVTDEPVAMSTIPVKRELWIEQADTEHVLVRESFLLAGQELDHEQMIILGEPPCCILIIKGMTPVSWHPLTTTNKQPFTTFAPIRIPLADVDAFQNKYAPILARHYSLQSRTKRVVVPELGIGTRRAQSDHS